MKMIIQKSLTYLLLLSFFAGHMTLAQSNANIQSKSSKTLKVKLLNDENSSSAELFFTTAESAMVVVKILNEEKETVFQEAIKDVEKLRKVYDLSSLSAGSYQIEVNNTKDLIQVGVKVVEGGDAEHPNKGKTLLIGFSKLDTDKYLNFIVQNKLNEKVDVNVYDQRNEKILTQSIGKDPVIKHKLNFSTLESGKYIVKVGTKDNIFTKEILLN
ncbi:T9SS type A sorting domain-containing protein [Fulvivirgaceae bacterium BMA10]|uniref:T9SS type A sorting domain-containing protein n=1 Tax=Splendidivirga corallicola TaxID=3051826 RepID=A0ABT8KMX2_9BACT|nr:T9SS type A sorting domain-containing protein [Fulvivirgaceae bacterium BMA10]